MRILWITGSLLPEAIAKIRGEEIQKWNTTGSWIIGAAERLTCVEGIELSMLSTSQDVKRLTRVVTGKITSYAIPYGKGHFNENTAYNRYMEEIREAVQPDIVHIHGTEYSHGLAWLRVCGGKNVVISIQGMTSVYANYYHTGISNIDILTHISFRDIIRGGILREQARFKKRGQFEIEMIQHVNHIIGRTSWDKAHTWAINPNAEYHWGGETLRKEFYTGELWDYSKCHKHSIFLSQSFAPLKGLHQLLIALPIILREYPDTQVIVAGMDPTLGYDFSQWWRITGYGRYIKSLIRKLKIKDHLTFIGPKNAEEMKQELLKCNLFLCPSSIENSPNSLGEAQILGVPCIASYVGGIPDMMHGNEENLYRFEDIEMLAEKICTVFQNKEHQKDLSKEAAQRHNPQKNVEELMKIYESIIHPDL